mmetsp:Transcript_11817/g.28113  ORF Transcript_11817/g.28113 Transcript_11817/m.28113 type:complete len:224 (+) Transcript_11817:721-1392(+)
MVGEHLLRVVPQRRGLERRGVAEDGQGRGLEEDRAVLVALSDAVGRCLVHRGQVLGFEAVVQDGHVGTRLQVTVQALPTGLVDQLITQNVRGLAGKLLGDRIPIPQKPVVERGPRAVQLPEQQSHLVGQVVSRELVLQARLQGGVALGIHGEGLGLCRDREALGLGEVGGGVLEEGVDVVLWDSFAAEAPGQEVLVEVDQSVDAVVRQIARQGGDLLHVGGVH